MPYEEYFKAATESLIVTGRDGRILEANAATEQIFGYPPKELAGKPLEILLPERLREQHQVHLSRFFSAPHTRAMGLGMRLAGRRKDGGEFPVEVSLTYAPSSKHGEVAVAAVIDITQRLVLEREVLKAESVSSLGTIAAGIAHDLNNPLQIVLARTELLLHDLPDALPAEAREDLAVVRRHAQRASRIVAEFLRISRQRDKNMVSIQIGRLVDDALLLVGSQLHEGGIHVETLLDGSLPPVTGDLTALERVMINLLNNARDAMPKGGFLRIEGKLMKSRPGWMQVRVSDTGVGISPDQRDKIFELLYTTKSEGTGLGLWLSRRIAQEHNGRLEVESELGNGTTFILTLPVAAVPA